MMKSMSQDMSSSPHENHGHPKKGVLEFIKAVFSFLSESLFRLVLFVLGLAIIALTLVFLVKLFYSDYWLLSYGDVSAWKVDLDELRVGIDKASEVTGNQKGIIFNLDHILGNDVREGVSSSCNTRLTDVPYDEATGFHELSFDEFLNTFSAPPFPQAHYPFLVNENTRQPLYNCSLASETILPFFVEGWEAVTIPKDYEMPLNEDPRFELRKFNSSVFFLNYSEFERDPKSHTSSHINLTHWEPVEGLQSFFRIAPLKDMSNDILRFPLDLRSYISTFHVTNTVFDHYWLFYSGRGGQFGRNSEKQYSVGRQAERDNFDVKLRVYLNCAKSSSVGHNCVQLSLKDVQFPPKAPSTKIAKREELMFTLENSETGDSLSFSKSDFRTATGQKVSFPVNTNEHAITRTGYPHAASKTQMSNTELDADIFTTVFNETKFGLRHGWGSGEKILVKDFGVKNVNITCRLENPVSVIHFLFDEKCAKNELKNVNFDPEHFSPLKVKNGITTVSLHPKGLNESVYKPMCDVSFFKIVGWDCLLSIVAEGTPENAYLSSFVDERTLCDDVECDQSSKISDWKVVFSDEFHADQIDETKWKIEEGKISPNFDHLRVVSLLQGRSGSQKENVKVSNGRLYIAGGSLGGKGPFEYGTGIVSSQNSFRFLYGKIDVRAKVSTFKSSLEDARNMKHSNRVPFSKNSSYGYEWFFRMVHSVDSSSSNEHFSSDGTAFNRSYISLAKHCRSFVQDNLLIDKKDKFYDRHIPDFELTFDEFHTYSVEWNPFSLKFLIDGKLVGVSERLTYQSMSLELGMMVGGGMGQIKDFCSWCKHDPIVRNLNDTIYSLDDPDACFDSFEACKDAFKNVRQAYDAYESAITRDTVLLEIEYVRVMQNRINPGLAFKGFARNVSNETDFVDQSTSISDRSLKGHANYNLIFSDEFANNLVDERRWKKTRERPLDMGVVPEQAYFTPDFTKSDMGHLKLYATHNPDFGKNDGYPFLGSRVTSRESFSFTYGIMEVRAKLSPLCGAVSAIWLLFCDNDPFTYPCTMWPPEIDVLEYTKWGNDLDEAFLTYHFVNESSSHIGDGQRAISKDGQTLRSSPWHLDKSFHTYKMEWDESSIVFSVDDKVFKTVKSGPYAGSHVGDFGKNISITDKPMHVILNLGVGGGIVSEYSDRCVFPRVYARTKKFAEKAPNGIWCLGDRRMCSIAPESFKGAIELLDQSALVDSSAADERRGGASDSSKASSSVPLSALTWKWNSVSLPDRRVFEGPSGFSNEDDKTERHRYSHSDIQSLGTNSAFNEEWPNHHPLEVDYVRVYQKVDSRDSSAGVKQSSWSRMVIFGGL